MTNLSPEFCKQIATARRQAGLTQSDLAREVGCKQPALSMFEQGDGTKLNDEVIERMAKKFGLKLTTGAGAATGTQVLPSSLRAAGQAFCPNPHCPSNHEYFVETRRLLRPDRAAADPAGGKFCAVCGELLERRCPSCGAAVHEGAICTFCGESYVAMI